MSELDPQAQIRYRQAIILALKLRWQRGLTAQQAAQQAAEHCRLTAEQARLLKGELRAL
jgi:hypothetical protein